MKTDNKFRVVLSGEIQLAFVKEDVVNSLAELFKTTPDKVKHYLDGEQRALAKHYDKSQADKIAQLIDNAGAKVLVMTDEKWQEIKAQKQTTSAPLPENNENEVAKARQPQSAYSENEHEQSDRNYIDEDASTEQDDFQEGFSEASDQRNLQNFVQKNWAYYERRFALFQGGANARLKLSWHWPGFFVFFFWACYRKMWLPAGIYLVLSVLVNLVLMSNIGFLILHLGAGLTANFIYYRHAHKQIARYGNDDLTLQRIGGVSALALIASVIGIFILYNYIGNLYLGRILEQNKAQFESYQPGSGMQLLGDQPIVTLDNLSADQKRTLSILSQSAVRLKLFELLMMTDNNPQALSMMPMEADAWGNLIQFRQNQNNTFELRSAGQDGRYDTQDDMIQPFKLTQNQQ